MSNELKFLNDIVKPWDELNSLLIERKAFQPDLSSVTSRVAAISTAIKHQVDAHALAINCLPRKLQSEVDAESLAARLVSDVSDTAKHVVLSTSARQTSIFVAAMFEVNAGGNFCFLRNGVFIEHATLGRHDFMQTSLAAIEYWSRKRRLEIAWKGSVQEANSEFFPTAFLYFDENYCINMTSAQFQCFRRDASGLLHPFDPVEVRFELR